MTETVSSPRAEQGAGATAALALAMLLASLGTSIANIALPALAEAFRAPFAEVQWVVIAYLGALTASSVLVGRLGDRYGLLPVLNGGLVLFAVSALFAGLATSLTALVLARALQGAAAAILMTLAMALMRATAAPDRLGRAMGLLGTVSALGTALGPSLGGMLLPVTGWRGVFLVQAPLAVLALTLAVSYLPRSEAVPPGQPASALGRQGWRAILPNLTVNALVAAVMMTTLVVGPFYLGGGLGLSATMVGAVMTIGPVISIVSGVPSGRLVDRLGAPVVLVVGLGLLATGAALMALLPPTLGVAGYGLAVIVLTPGYQLFQAANNTTTLADVPPARRGTVSGLLGLSRNLGLIAGASAMGAVFAAGVGQAEMAHAAPEALAQGLRLTFALAAGLMVTALAIVWAGRR